MDLSDRLPRPFPPPFADAWGDDRFGLWAAFTLTPETGDDEPVTQRLRWIEPGNFLMGSPPDEPERLTSEGPQHRVTLTRGVWLADTACTQALWQAVTGQNPSGVKGANRPVETVSWDDVQAFLEHLDRRLPGCTADLPTEAEWEYACRAGTTTPFSFGATVGPDAVNYDGNHPYAGGEKGLYRNRTVDVGTLPPNPWGLYEMHGNVWEWCADGPRSYDDAAQTDPRGPGELDSTSATRVHRGGSWINGAGRARSARRHAAVPRVRSDGLGFRLCLRSIQPGPDRGPIRHSRRSPSQPGGRHEIF